ncbi:hypothetical protein BDY19DRAFT_994593 [Irpex rosettiformis]|uniref:Uncharacterized protein n=1 Tax=Irpex rosettiformis TaxID=378272 RepID=A0ACB8U0C0_9APHY|nr:hypothetical protein BDY19DRAFT_994593 [Irpex rosettiformis]
MQVALSSHPESTLDAQDNGTDGTVLLLRREENNWKREFVTRWNLKRRWERTRSSSTISHVPVHSAVSDICLLALDTRVPPVLLTASMSYGVVARSQPLTGKIAKGYLDASGTLNGLGHGNPNAEFSPNLAQCVITSAGGAAAKVLWAFRTGVVALTTTPKAADFSRPCQAQWKRCKDEDAHVGTIEHAVWIHANGSSNRFFATAGSDGRVKVWDGENIHKSPWTSPLEKKDGAIVTVRDGCMRVAVDVGTGVVAALRHSGEVTIWCGLKHVFVNEPDRPSIGEKTIRLAVSPIFLQPLEPSTEPRSALSFDVYTGENGTVSVLTTYTRTAFFTKTIVDLNGGHAVETTIFGQDSLGQITSVQVALPDNHPQQEQAFVVAGDVFGYVSIFDLNGTPTLLPESTQSLSWRKAVAPFRRFSAFDGSAITAIHWIPAVLVVGSAHGVLKAFDATTFDFLREFKLSFVRTMTERDAVTRIQVVRDLVVAAVDDRVYAWRGEPTGNVKPGRGKNKATRMPNGLAKWHQQVEMYKDIVESQRTYERETAHARRAFGREREQNTTLASLGLSEVEAVEYVLMLSRDEEERRRAAEIEDGGFAGEFDEDIDAQTGHSARTGVSAPTNVDGGGSSGRYVSRTPPSFVDAVHANRVQVSPRVRPEPVEAGVSFGGGISRSISSISSSSSTWSGSLGRSVEDENEFPRMASTPTRLSVSGSLESSSSGSRGGSAWSTPLRMTMARTGSIASSPSSSSPISRTASSGNMETSRELEGLFGRMDVGSGSSAEAEEGSDELDNDLRFAIELSLAEARSRGEGA